MKHKKIYIDFLADGLTSAKRARIEVARYNEQLQSELQSKNEIIRNGKAENERIIKELHTARSELERAIRDLSCIHSYLRLKAENERLHHELTKARALYIELKNRCDLIVNTETNAFSYSPLRATNPIISKE